MARQVESPSTAVERTLLMLEAVAQRESGMSNADFSRKLKIPKSSASYILRTLEQRTAIFAAIATTASIGSA